MRQALAILFFGDGPWAHKALKKIISNGYEVNKVIVRNDYKDPKLIEIAKEYQIDYGWHSNVNSIEFLDSIIHYRANLAVSMSFNQIIRRNTIEQFEYGFINCHAGKLPLYRGRNILNWALINDEKEVGVTCHYIDEGIDTGDIILQKTFSITDQDDYSSLLEKAINLCPEVLLESIDLISENRVKVVKQSLKGTYFIQRKEGDEFINWCWVSRRIFNFVRAITTPGPCAQSWIQIQNKYYKVIVKKVSIIDDTIDYICTNGAVVGIKNGKPIVKTGDNILLIEEYSILDNKKKKMRVGDRLGINMNLLMTGKVTFNKS